MRTTTKQLFLSSLLLSMALLIAGPANAASLYFPHIVTSTPWQTEIAVINTSAQEVTGTLTGRSDTGLVRDTKPVTLSPHGRRQIIVANEFANHTDIGYIVFDSSSAAVQGYTKFSREGYYRAAIPAVKEVNSSGTLYIPHIASNADWWTGVSLVNTTATPKVLTITFNNDQSRQITLAANEHRAFDIASEFFNNQPQPGILSAVITNASAVIGLELFGSLGLGAHLEGILLTDKTTPTIYYPHVAGNEWWTGIVAYNPSVSECRMTIRPYKADGTILSSQEIPIPGKGKYIGTVANLNLPAETAWFKIDSSSPITGFELFGTLNGAQLAAYAERSGSGAKAGVFAKIEKDGGWTGIAFVNTEAAPANVTLTAYADMGGSPIATRPLSVGGYAKVVNYPAVIFTEDISSATYIAYTSDKNVVGFQLNGTSDGMMLDGLPGLADSEDVIMMTAPRTIAMIVDSTVTAADRNGLVAQLAQAISADYAARAGSHDAVVSTTIISSPVDAVGVIAALKGVNNLWGIMLIGKVPAPLSPSWSRVGGQIAPWDAPYKAPNCGRFTVASDGSVSESNNPLDTPTAACTKTAWLSRIYGTPDQVLAFIQKDLNMRHTSSHLQKYGYVRGGWFGGMIDPDMAMFWINNALYSSGNYLNYVTNYGTTDNTALSRLQDIKKMLADGYEFVTLNVHGSPASIMIEGTGVLGTAYSSDKVVLTSSDLLGLPNHARVINLISCSTGNFFDTNFFAGAALFGGDTLLVIANTVVTGVSSSYEQVQVMKKYHLLANGATFADIDMAPDGPTVMFGDPTISLRPLQEANRPILSISTDGVNFSRYQGPLADLDVPFAQGSTGGEKAQQTITLRNDGITDLAVQLTFMPEFLGVNGKYPCSQSCGGLGFTLDAPAVVSTSGSIDLGNIVLTVPAGRTLPITFGLAPMTSLTTRAPIYGAYTSRYEIHTVDPRGGALGASDPRIGRLNLYLSGSVTQ